MRMRMGMGLGMGLGGSMQGSADNPLANGVGSVISRLTANSATAANIKRNTATYYIASDYIYNGDDHYKIYTFPYYKCAGLLSPPQYGVANELQSGVTDSSTHSNSSGAGSDDLAPFMVMSSIYNGGNHCYTKISCLKITYSDVFASQASEANSIVEFDANYISAISTTLFGLIGKPNVTITRDGADIPIVIIGVFPGLWNETQAAGRLKNVYILFAAGHGSATATDWAYTQYTSGTVAGLKYNGSEVDLTLSHAGGGADLSVSAYALATYSQAKLDLYYGGGYLDWLYPSHFQTSRIVGSTFTNKNGDDLFIPVKTTPAAKTIFTDAQNWIEVTQEYQVTNVYLMINAILAAYAITPYTFDPVAFNVAGRNSGYYGNPDYSLMNVPAIAVVDKWRFRGWGGIELRQDSTWDNAIGTGIYIKGVQFASAGGALGAALPTGDANAGKFYQVLNYVPNGVGYDKIQVQANVTFKTSNTYANRIINRQVLLSATSHTTNQIRTNRHVEFMACGFSPSDGDTTDAKRLAACPLESWVTSTSKSYPVALKGVTALTPYLDTAFKSRAYRQTLPSGSGSAISEKATAVYWHLSDDLKKAYVYIDYHRDVTDDIVTLPSEFAGMRYTLLESNNGVEVSGSSPSRSIAISVATTVSGKINANSTLLVTTANTGDTVYAGAPTDPTTYDLSGTTLVNNLVPITGYPDGNLAYIILEIA